MGSRLTTTHRTLRLLTASFVALTLLVTLGVTPASAAKSATCVVTNTHTGETYTRLQQAVDAAKPGAHLVVKGTCHGGTVIDKSLVIRGVRSERRGRPILDGDEKTRVLTIGPKADVSIRDLTIRDGHATGIRGGGGISNKGRLTVRDVLMRENYSARRGGGIYNAGVLRTMGRTVVKWNRVAPTRRGMGSGVYNDGRLVLDDRTRIFWNGGGSVVVNAGTLVMNDSSDISLDVFAVWNYGHWTMNDASSVSWQGRVYNSGTLVLNDASSIHHNSVGGGALGCGTGLGGGVYNSGSLTLNGSASIHDNSVIGGCSRVTPASDDRARGAGVYNSGSLTMTGSSRIYDNAAHTLYGPRPGLGGGLYNASGGTLVGVNCAPHTYANVYGNTPDDCYFEP